MSGHRGSAPRTEANNKTEWKNARALHSKARSILTNQQLFEMKKTPSGTLKEQPPAASNAPPFAAKLLGRASRDAELGSSIGILCFPSLTHSRFWIIESEGVRAPFPGSCAWPTAPASWH
jgi:hypothetical protein